jgi:hypothetical protein|tara:strand:+ start:326 stop:532 length:207 start_codon:yes stop_codon:yes gene_type:complete
LRSGRIRPLVLSARSQCAAGIAAARENGGEGHDEILLLFVLVFVLLRVVLIGFFCAGIYVLFYGGVLI